MSSMTVLRHRVLNDGQPVVGLVATVMELPPETAQGAYRRVKTVTAYSNHDGWLSWELPKVVNDSLSVPKYVVNGIEAYPVVVAVPLSVSTATVTETRIGVLSGISLPQVDLVTEDEISERLAGITAELTDGLLTDDQAQTMINSASATAIAAANGYTDGQVVAAKERANHLGTQPATTISDLTETVQTIVNALIQPGTNVTKTYDAEAGILTINATATGGGTTDPEIVRDVIGTALLSGSGVDIAVSDAGDSITISFTGVLPTRQIIAGAGLSGGGDLSADRTLSVVFGTTAGTVLEGTYAPPSASTTVKGLAELATASETTNLTNGAVVVTPQSLKPLADTKAATDDPRFTDARTPTAHATTHASGGTDVLTPAAIGAVEAVTAGLRAQIITQAAFDALGTKDGTTLYLIQS